MSAYVLELEITGLPKLPNQLLGSHWRVRSSHADRWRKAVIAHVGRKKPAQPLTSAVLSLTRISSVRPDHDGLCGSFKAVVDALVHAGVIEDDTHEIVGVPKYDWEKGARSHGKIRIRVESVEAGE